MLAFLIKLPLFGVHAWLPKAHVEAPVVGSMVLAGVLLKLGGYGLLRVAIFCPPNKGSLTVLTVLALVGALVCSLLCFRQHDLKSIVAYSSVVHMARVVMVIKSFESSAVLGVVLVMVAHGLVRRGLFLVVKRVYQLSGTRSAIVNTGFLNAMPTIRTFWFLLCVQKMSFPPLLSFIAEVLIFGKVIELRPLFG